jgi:3-oxocholest-4-en-26-oyl-CoA dehydrogenase alpha subunit
MTTAWTGHGNFRDRRVLNGSGHPDRAAGDWPLPSVCPPQDHQAVRIALTEEQERLRREVREYLAALLTPETRAALSPSGPDVDGDFGDASTYRELVRQIGRDGWLGLGWPREYGGQGRSAMEQLLFTDEAAVAGVPLPVLTLSTVAPTILRYGTEAQRRDLLPRILGGELHFAIGYTEPGSGSDLAGLRTRARLEGDDWVVDGEKTWTSHVQYADYVWLACRTDPDLPRHQGLSILLVPTDAAGFSSSPIQTVAGIGSRRTAYDGVRVPLANLVGERNGGWALITHQLNLQRLALASSALLVQSIREVTDWAQQVKNPDGSRVIDAEWVQVLLGRAHGRADMLTLLNWQLASATSPISALDASAAKVSCSETAAAVYRTLLEVVGPEALVEAGSAGAVLRGRLERRYRAVLVMTFDGGADEIQRDIIARHGLGLPRAAR